MNEYPPQSADHHGDAEFAASIQALEERLGIVATEGQVQMTAEADKDASHSSGVLHSAEDIDSVLDAAYSRNQAYDAILEEGDAVYDQAAKMNEAHDVKQAAELRQMIDEALMELQQAENEAEAESNQAADKETKIDNTKTESKTGDSKTAEAAKTSLIMNPDYPKAVLTQAHVETLPGQAAVDAATGQVVVTNILNENSLTIVSPHIGGEPTVITYDFYPKDGKLVIKTDGTTTETLVAREATGDTALGEQKKIELPSPVADIVGAKFVLAA